MLVLIPHPLAMVDFRKACAHQLMSACAMEYLILGSYRFYEPILLFLTLSLACILLVTDDNDLFLQNGDIINIDVTVYLDVCFSLTKILFRLKWSQIQVYCRCYLYNYLELSYKLQFHSNSLSAFSCLYLLMHAARMFSYQGASYTWSWFSAYFYYFLPMQTCFNKKEILIDYGMDRHALVLVLKAKISKLLLLC